MGKRPKPKQPEAEARVAPGGTPAPPPPWPRRAAAAAGLVAFLLAGAWALLCLRAGQHHRAGLAAERDGGLAQAAREYESAVGCCAPFNPYCGESAKRMLALAEAAAPSDPALAGDVRDRAVRALQSTRWLFQPHRDLLETARSGVAGPTPRDPSAPLFLLSCLALAAGLGGWWLPLTPWRRWAVGCGGFAAWAALLYLC